MAKVTIHVAKFGLKTSAGATDAGTEILPDTHAKLFTKAGNPTKELKALVDDYKAVTLKEVTVVTSGKDDDETGKVSTGGDGSDDPGASSDGDDEDDDETGTETGGTAGAAAK
ncbi:hypothetical protein [uncultured Cohaesibacter sp.]|uniref:hypothetical protein n=1 Tax=uncultured Cohaesibacter sp. TaxID=1002546 RepID=UPI0029C66212|nr:hypothetical protein [uncultured Cohaesibacter sp.]